ncbi:MAG: alpha/beta fold hydrolase [Bacteroidetes bacterium]|nr:alpha/beta fold hydrolase [Bacteroidota bacterium]
MRPLVLLHGFLGDPATFDVLVEGLDGPALKLDLGEPFPVTDQLSAGLDAEADRLLGVIASHGIDDFDLLGYSLGGRVAMHMARRASDRVQRLVLESAHPGLDSEAEREARRAHDARWAERIRKAWPAVLNEWYDQAVFASLAGTPLRDTLLHEKSDQDPEVAARQLEAWSLGRQANLWPFLGTWNRPILFISGEMDGRYTGVGERLATASGPIRHLIVEGAGHVVHREQPGPYLAALRSFL